MTKHNFNLTSYNTFALNVCAKKYMAIHDTETLSGLTPLDQPYFVLGGGSNILFTKDFDGLLLHNLIKGKTITTENNDEVIVRIGGGENWHQFVMWCIEQNWGGVENLSLIPGTVGAAPIQNIGAYGVELKDIFHSLEAINLQSGQLETFSKDDCQFGYRNSIFKNEKKGKYLISYVNLILQKKPSLNLSYGSIESTMNELNLPNNIQGVAEAVMTIRRNKLPDPQQIGNAGSFFKNPVISSSQFKNLLEKHANIPHYPSGDMIKVPAAWLIDQLGWKGHRRNDAGVHTQQALVIVNHGNACGDELFELAKDIQADVHRAFGIQLEMEVNIL